MRSGMKFAAGPWRLHYPRVFVLFIPCSSVRMPVKLSQSQAKGEWPLLAMYRNFIGITCYINRGVAWTLLRTARRYWGKGRGMAQMQLRRWLAAWCLGMATVSIWKQSVLEQILRDSTTKNSCQRIATLLLRYFQFVYTLAFSWWKMSEVQAIPQTSYSSHPGTANAPVTTCVVIWQEDSTCPNPYLFQ